MEASDKVLNKELYPYNISTARNKYARSLDGGVTWRITEAYEIVQKSWGHDNNVPLDKAIKPIPMTEPIKDFTDPGFLLTFLRHNTIMVQATIIILPIKGNHG